MSVPLFYVPSLRHQAAPADVPANVAFFPCGLATPDDSAFFSSRSGAALAACRAACEALPLDAGRARAVLAELLLLGEAYGPGGMLRELTERDRQGAPLDSWAGQPGEFADLDVFAASGTLPENLPASDRGSSPAGAAGETSPAIKKALVDSQKTLLLIFSLEERASEAATLEDRYKNAEEALKAALGDGAVEDVSPLSLSPAMAAGAALPPVVAWQAMLDAALAFLPEGSGLFTADQTMSRDLRDAGLIQPLPAERATVCADWPEELVSGMGHVRAPGYRLVGRRGPVAGRPWLEREVELFVVSPFNGWTDTVEKQ